MHRKAHYHLRSISYTKKRLSLHCIQLTHSCTSHEPKCNQSMLITFRLVSEWEAEDRRSQGYKVCNNSISKNTPTTTKTTSNTNTITNTHTFKTTIINSTCYAIICHHHYQDNHYRCLNHHYHHHDHENSPNESPSRRTFNHQLSLVANITT